MGTSQKNFIIRAPSAATAEAAFRDAAGKRGLTVIAFSAERTTETGEILIEVSPRIADRPLWMCHVTASKSPKAG